MKQKIGTFLIAATAIAATSCAVHPNQRTFLDSGAPKLVVLLVVDQLRADLMDRHRAEFVGGFKRLHDEGYSYVNASHDHAATETAPGHASLSTGVYPSRHGVIANTWYEFSGGRWVSVSNVGDSAEKIIGNPDRPGASPHYQMKSGFADWLVAASPNSRVASVSGKDRAAIHSAAHVKGHVYWFDGLSSRFVTSTYYRDADPDWITAFTNGALQAHRADTVWTLASSGVGSPVVHRFSVEGRPNAFWSWWAATPYADVATLELARSMVRSLDLGRDASPDFLNLGLSATDRIGHAYGPTSGEQRDNLLRLDRELGAFFSFLDKAVGKGNWTLMLTADHGVLEMPEVLRERGEYGHRLTPAENAKLDLLRAEAIANPDRRAAATKLAAELKRLQIIGDAWTRESLMSGQPTDSFAVLRRRSMYEGRVAGRFSREGVEFRFIPGIPNGPREASHSQGYWYDRRVPMIFMGPGIRAGRDATRASTVDVAPTFAEMLRIPYPKDLDGKVLKGVATR